VRCSLALQSIESTLPSVELDLRTGSRESLPSLQKLFDAGASQARRASSQQLFGELNNTAISRDHHSSSSVVPRSCINTNFKMVRLTEVEDEHFHDNPAKAGDEVLLAEDDEDYTDTGTGRLPSPPATTDQSC